jgi:spermidine synthase
MNSVLHSRAKPAVDAALLLLGGSAVIGQIVLMRELIVVFGGNEISLGVMLATWLFWTATGSALGGVLMRRGRHSRLRVATLECLLGLSLPPTVWLVRLSRGFMQSVPGEQVGPLPMLLTALITLSLFCVVSGALFVAAARWRQEGQADSARFAASPAYLLEAAGSAFGGLAASLVLLRFLGSFQIAFLVTLANLCLAAQQLFRAKRRGQFFSIAAVLLLAVPLLANVAPWLEQAAEARLWSGFQLAASRDSIYGKLSVIETREMRSLYDNGVLLANAPDESAAEESAHYALLEHPAPRQVLMIGGGINGGITQALQHPTIERLDYVEIDPALLDLAREYFPAQWAPVLADRRVHLHHIDGRRYLQRSSNRSDVILLNTPDPQTAQLNRFYTREFFQTARDHLAPGGVLALQLRSSEETITPDLSAFLRCIHKTVRQVFPYTAAIPGETVHLFATSQPGILTEDPQTLIARLQSRHLRTQYVREYFLPYRMAPERETQLEEQMRPLPETPVNRDFAPIAYYFDVVLWSSQFKTGYAGGFRHAACIAFPAVRDTVLLLSLLTALGLSMLPGGGRRQRANAAYCVAANGFTLMTLQIFLLLAFQSIHGYVYHQLAILIAMCMAGIAVGSWLAMRVARPAVMAPIHILPATQWLLALSAPALVWAAALLAKCSGTVTIWLAAQLVFPALAALCGILGGFQFCVATEIYIPKRGHGTGLGVIYALDLLGGCAGALLLSGFLVPVFGFWKTAWLTAAINLAPALLAMRASRKQNPAGGRAG